MKPPYSGNGCLKGLSSIRRPSPMPGCKVCVSTLYDVRTTTKSSNDTFLRRIPAVKRRMTVIRISKSRYFLLQKFLEVTKTCWLWCLALVYTRFDITEQASVVSLYCRTKTLRWSYCTHTEDNIKFSCISVATPWWGSNCHPNPPDVALAYNEVISSGRETEYCPGSMGARRCWRVIQRDTYRQRADGQRCSLVSTMIQAILTSPLWLSSVSPGKPWGNICIQMPSCCYKLFPFRRTSIISPQTYCT